MDLDPSKIIEALTRIETQYKAIHDNLHAIQKNLTLGDGSTLRDSVKRVIGEEMREQHNICGRDMKTIADTSAGIAVAAHIKEYHMSKRTSNAPGISLRIDKTVFIKLLPYIVGGGGAFFGIWQLVEKLIN